MGSGATGLTDGAGKQSGVTNLLIVRTGLLLQFTMFGGIFLLNCNSESTP